MAQVRITHFSDILCVWAYIGQVRVAELRANFPQDVVFEFRYFNVFGDVQSKMDAQWGERGGVSGYARHVHETAEQFDHVKLNRAVWIENVPTSSVPAHLLVAAARLLDIGKDAVSAPAFDAAIRAAFFESAVDESRTSELLIIADRQGIDVAALEAGLESGRAHALLASDLKCAEAFSVRSSPTMTFNEGRQTLSGNVGYRMLEANIGELIRRPVDQQSWC